MKKLLISFLSLFLFPLSAFALTFSDVPEDHQNFEAIEFLAENEVIDGYEDGSYKPQDSVNRAEAVKIIVNAFGVSHGETYEQLFPDVNSEDWFFDFVMGAVDAGILDGYGDGTFRPGNSVNLAETLKIVVLATGFDLPGIDTDVFADVSGDQWFAAYAMFARENNILVADIFGNVYPDKAMSRGDFTEIIYRAMYVAENNGEKFPLAMNWTEYHSSTLPFSMKYDAELWEVDDNKDEVVIFQKDAYFSQTSAMRLYPNTGRVSVTVDANEEGLSASSYFSIIEKAFPDGEFTKFNLNGLDALEVVLPNDNIVDWYVYLDDRKILLLYSDYGDGLLGFQIPNFIEAMYKSLEIVEPRRSNEDILSEIYANVLVEGKGMEMVGILPDRVIIETDTIGVGTGPVDYYYSEILDFTLKYERYSDVILDTRDSRTSAF